MPGFAGFDRSDYPGDAVMEWLKANTNLVWCGYYLAPAPSHGSTTWMRERAALSGAGWGIAPIYVGQQVIAPGSLNPSATTGQADGADAAELMQSEGFAANSFVYLDLENGPPLTPAQQDYVGSWADAVTANGYTPAVYCSHGLVDAVLEVRPGIRIWAFRVPTTAPNAQAAPYPQPDPSGSGYAGAYAWQLGQHCLLTVPPAKLQTLNVDLDTALSADPSAPDAG